MKRIALIISGGAGERFWPLSRPGRPKQLLALGGSDRVMLDESVQRIEQVFGLENIFIITSTQLSEPIREQLPWLSSQVFEEPEKRNSAGAVVWGMGLLAGLLGPEELSFAILPSDHRIHPGGRFRSTVLNALGLAENSGRLVTIGVTPNRPETGYGYIEAGKAIHADSSEVAQFIEKPSEEVAAKLIKKPNMLWNSGMFFWRYDSFLREAQLHSPAHAEALLQITESVARGNTASAASAFRSLPNISVDHALMEHSKSAAVVRADFEWDDLGAWDSIARVFPGDANGNVILGPAQAVESEGCIAYNTNPGQMLKLLGMNDMIVVVTEDAILVCPKDRAQDVRKLAQ